MMTEPNPTVSVVIPTRHRPELVVRAVRSALGQTFRNLEVLVVIDGPDLATAGALREVRDPRLRLLQLSQSVGGAGARNEGVKAAGGEWVAFLDDDDEWLAVKLDRQLQIARQSYAREPILACRLIASTPSGRYVWPRRMIRPGEHVSDFVMSRTDLFQGEGLLQT